MLPDNRISSTDVIAPFLTPKRNPTDLLIDYEIGGVDIQDTSQGLDTYLWSCSYEQGWVVLNNPVEKTEWRQVSGVTEISFAFDQNMRPIIAYVSSGQTYLNWYDSASGDYVTTAYGSSTKSPRLSLDDNREALTGTSDVIFAYVKDDQVFYRQQRDRFQVEYLVGDLPDGLKLVQVGMSRKYRFQFKMY